MITLLQLLEKQFPDSSKRTLKQWIEWGRISVNGKFFFKPIALVPSDAKAVLSSKTKSLPSGVPILYEDKDLIVLDKPPGLLSVDLDEPIGRSLHGMLKEYCEPNKVYPVHRLDREASGVIAFALSKEMQEKLKAKFERHDIERCYYALVEGITPDKGTWKSYLIEDDFLKVKSVFNGGKLAITHYEKIEEKEGYSLLRVQLETGRKNQIRVHASENGYPIAGDHKYGAKTDPYERLALYAYHLSFIHPLLEKRVTFKKELPSFLKGGEKDFSPSLSSFSKR